MSCRRRSRARFQRPRFHRPTRSLPICGSSDHGVQGEARFHSRRHEFSCPVCGGTQEEPKGTGKRCRGWTLTGDKYLFVTCSRPEYGGESFDHSTHGEMFRHRLDLTSTTVGGAR